MSVVNEVSCVGVTRCHSVLPNTKLHVHAHAHPLFPLDCTLVALEYKILSSLISGCPRVQYYVPPLANTKSTSSCLSQWKISVAKKSLLCPCILQIILQPITVSLPPKLTLTALVVLLYVLFYLIQPLSLKQAPICVFQLLFGRQERVVEGTTHDLQASASCLFPKLFHIDAKMLDIPGRRMVSKDSRSMSSRVGE